MFDIGFTELLLLAMIVLVVVGPEKLPSTLKVVLRYFRQFKNGFKQIRDEVEKELSLVDLNEEIVETKERIQTTIKDSLDYDDLKGSIKDIEKDSQRLSKSLKQSSREFMEQETATSQEPDVSQDVSVSVVEASEIEPPIVTLEDLKAFEAEQLQKALKQDVLEQDVFEERNLSSEGSQNKKFIPRVIGRREGRPVAILEEVKEGDEAPKEGWVTVPVVSLENLESLDSEAYFNQVVQDDKVSSEQNG